MLSARFVDSIFVPVLPELFLDIVIDIVQEVTPKYVKVAVSTAINHLIIFIQIS